MDTRNRITLQIIGADKDNGNVRFDDFIKQLGAFKHTLSEIDRVISERTSVYFKVVDLRHNSPAVVVLEAIPLTQRDNNSEIIVEKFFSSLDEIEKGVAPSGFDFPTYQSFKELTSLLGKRITQILVSRNGDAPKSLEYLSRNVDSILGPDEYEMGSVSGLLEQINVHANQNIFTIYPTSKLPKLRCVFPKELRAEAVRSVDHYVRVYGQMKFKTRLKGAHPYEMLVKEIEIYPPDDELPTLSELLGVAPNATGDLTSDEFIRRVRHEW